MNTFPSLCAVLVGNAPTAEQAAQFSTQSQHCPYVAHYSSTGRLIVGVFVIPTQKRWWLDIPPQRPELLGMERIEVFFAQDIKATSAWSRGETRPEANNTPCGTDCGACPYYRTQCEGCPVTTYYCGQ